MYQYLQTSSHTVPSVDNILQIDNLCQTVTVKFTTFVISCQHLVHRQLQHTPLSNLSQISFLRKIWPNILQLIIKVKSNMLKDHYNLRPLFAAQVASLRSSESCSAARWISLARTFVSKSWCWPAAKRFYRWIFLRNLASSAACY